MTIGLAVFAACLMTPKQDSTKPRGELMTPAELHKKLIDGSLANYKDGLARLERTRRNFEQKPDSEENRQIINWLKGHESWFRQRIADLERGELTPRPFEMHRPEQKAPRQKD